MQPNFAPSLAHVLTSEGGYVDDPRDPGGATNKGITQAVYDAYRTRCALPHQSVRYVTDLETAAIYKHEYWDRVDGDNLPTGVDYAVFDFAVNSGVRRASQFLQGVVGVDQDGVIGPATVAAVIAMGAKAVIHGLNDRRLAFLRYLPTFGHFGGGWTTRVHTVEAEADKEAQA